MNLVLDIGNTLVKTAVFQGDEILGVYNFSEISFSEKLKMILDKYPKITNSILSTVTKDSQNIVQKLVHDYNLIQLTAHTPQPFTNLYATKESLGNDRIALAAAASKLYPYKNVLVIDAGTCITFDFKNNKNHYLGGAISPGLQMRFNALHTFTANLPLLTPKEDIKLIGNTTNSSIMAGVVNGLLGEIDSVINAYKKEYEDLTIIFTGGDTKFLSKRVKNGIFANSNFLLEGLNYILEFNKTQ